MTNSFCIKPTPPWSPLALLPEAKNVARKKIERIERREKMELSEVDTAEAAFLHRLAAGDDSAVAELYDRLAHPLYALAYRILQNQQEAEESVQEAFVEFWRKAHTYDANRGRVFTWAMTIVRRKAIDRLRASHRRLPRLPEPPETEKREESVASEAFTHLDQQENAVRVRKALGRLPEEQKRAIELAFFSGLTQAEISEKLAEPLGTVKARIRRGMLKLRDFLKGEVP